MGADEERRPQTADASILQTTKKPKGPSLLGSRLGRLDLAKTGGSIATATGHSLALTSSARTDATATGMDSSLVLASSARSGSDPMALTTPRLPTVDPNVTKRISRKYKAEVEKSEKQRAMTYVPLTHRDQIPPDDRQMARTVKKDLDGILKQSGKDTVPWDSLFGTDGMQKKMQYLGGHAINAPATEELLRGGNYEGEFLFSLRHGAGKQEFQDDVYDGGWMWDKRHGAGTLTQSDGTTISGTWKAGLLDGHVSMKDRDGKIFFEGEFKDGKRHGIGRLDFPNGDRYDGGWKQGVLHDRGSYHYANGDVLIGMWHEGRYDGPAMLMFEDGSASRRVYKDGVLVSSQDFQTDTQKFGKEANRDFMLKHTTKWEYPKQAVE